jgi:hypothetical protein
LLAWIALALVDDFAPINPVLQHQVRDEEDEQPADVRCQPRELSIPGVASPAGAGYDFWDNQSRIEWRGGRMDWARTLAFVTGMVDQELLARSEYLAAENWILKARLKGRLKLSDTERATLAEIGHRLGRKGRAIQLEPARP